MSNDKRPGLHEKLGQWRERREDRRALRLERRGRGNPDIQSDRGYGEAYRSGGYFTKGPKPK
jgi:hypothetical protein